MDEKKNLEELEISFRNGKYCVHTLCECESVRYDYNTVIIFSQILGGGVGAVRRRVSSGFRTLRI